jgi:hypothetical protein
VLIVRVSGEPDLLWRTPSLSDEFIRCQSDHDDYVYSRDGVALSGGDGTDSTTQVSVARHVWVAMIMFYLIWY